MATQERLLKKNQSISHIVKAIASGKGAKAFEVRAATITKGKIEIRLDNISGTSNDVKELH